jgi:hypothetical protein
MWQEITETRHYLVMKKCMRQHSSMNVNKAVLHKNHVIVSALCLGRLCGGRSQTLEFPPKHGKYFGIPII